MAALIKYDGHLFDLRDYAMFENLPPCCFLGLLGLVALAVVLGWLAPSNPDSAIADLDDAGHDHNHDHR